MISPMQWYIAPEAEVGCWVQGPVELCSKTVSKKLGAKYYAPLLSFSNYFFFELCRCLLPVLCVHLIFQAYDMSERHQNSMYYEEWVTYEQWGMDTDCIAWYIDQVVSQWVIKIARVVCGTENVRPQSCHSKASGSEDNTTTHLRDTWRRGEKTLCSENTLGSWVATALGKTSAS